MSKFEVITSMNNKFYHQYGKAMIDSFLKRWPESIRLYVYHEDKLNDLEENSRVEKVNLYDVEPELKKFVNRHSGRDDQQNALELEKGAVRFAYKTFSILNGTAMNERDYVIWLDADTITYNDITEEFLDSLVDQSKYLTYLGRENNYSECGFVIYNTRHPVNKPFMETWRHLYESDELFKLEQWHDSFVFDQIRKIYEKANLIENINLSPWGKDYQHVFINSILGDYMDHLKGPRKKHGKSFTTDLIKPKDYWDTK